jgi:beta-RFAP synthase
MSSRDQRYRIESAARLHLGFLDLNGALGRSFGSIGMAVEGLSTVVVAEPGTELVVAGPSSARARDDARRILTALKLPSAIKLTIEEAIPAHAGLGSGTQMGLVVGAAISAVFDLEVPIDELVRLTGRGQRSGIGIGVFASGGFVIDGGRGPDTEVPPLVSRLPFPETWRVILVFDRDVQGLYGRDELDAFETLAPMPEAQAANLCRSVLVGLLPALAERDFPSFSRHVADIQSAVGDYFSPCQGGRYTSPRVRSVVEWLAANEGVIGSGQTSWGPTGFAFVETASDATAILRGLERRFAGEDALEFQICGGRNVGASVTALDRVAPRSAVTG